MSNVHPGDVDPDQLVDRAFTCARLRVSPSTLDRLVRSGAIPVYRIGDRSPRFRVADLNSYIESTREEVTR